MTDRKRLLRVNKANLRYHTLYVGDHFDFFPKEAFGGPKENGYGHGGIKIHLDGLNETVTTDIGSDPKSGKPRRFLRDRKSVRRFYEFHQVKAGTFLSLEKLAKAKYRLSVSAESNGSHPTYRAAEFFAGIGLVRLALEQAGWEVVFANDIDPDKAEMYRRNWPDDNHLVVGDIHVLDVNDIPACDLFTASFPCNDLSIAGKWEGLRSCFKTRIFAHFIHVSQGF